jgi:hypothetical protein
MSEPRAVDKLAGQGSIADRLRRHRIAMEAGDPEAAQRIAAGNELPEDAQYGGTPSNTSGDTTEKPKGGTPGDSPGKFKLLKDLLLRKK